MGHISILTLYEGFETLAEDIVMWFSICATYGEVVLLDQTYSRLRVEKRIWSSTSKC